MMKASPRSRKSFSTFPSNDNKSKSPRRKTINAHSLSHLEDAENSVNSGNQKRYSLRSPGLKRSSGVGLSGENSEFSGTANLLNLSDFVADRLDESCFSIHSEEDKRSEATPSESRYNSQKKDSRRDTFDGELNLSTSGMDTSAFSLSSGFAPTNDRRNTVDQNDISALMRDLEDSEEEGQSQCSLQISMSTVGSTIHGADISGVASEYNSETADENKRRRSSSARSVSSVSSLGNSEAPSEGTVSDLLMFSPSTPRSTRSRQASQASTPVPASAQMSMPSSALRSTGRSPARSSRAASAVKNTNNELFDEEASVGSLSMSMTRRSPRAASASKTLKASTPNFLDMTNSLSLPGDASLSTSMSVAGAEDTTAQHQLQQSSTEEGDLLGLDEESVCDLRSARKKDDRRTTVDAADMASLLAGLEDDSRDTSGIDLDTSVMSRRSTRSRRGSRAAEIEAMASAAGQTDAQEDDEASVSSVNTMQLELKISELLGADTPQKNLIGASSPTASVCATESMDLDEAHSQASTANMSDLSLLSTTSNTSKASKKGRVSVSKSPAKSPSSKSALNKSALNQSALSFSALNKSALKSPAKSVAASPASARSTRSRAKTPEPEMSVQMASASPAVVDARASRRDTVDPSDLGSLLDHSDLNDSVRAPNSRRNTVDPSDFMSLLDSSEVQESVQKEHDPRRETVDAASLDFLMNSSDIQEPVHNPRRETCDSIDMMSLLNSSELDSSALPEGQLHDRVDRRATMDPADMSALLNDISHDVSAQSPAVPVTSKTTTEVETDVLDSLDESQNGFESFTGRESIDMSVLQEMVANRLNDVSVLPSPANSDAPSTMSFSVFSTHQQNHQERRETVDPTAIADLLEEEMSVSNGNILALSTSNLSAHSQSFHKHSQDKSQSRDISRVMMKNTSAEITKKTEEAEMELTEEFTGDNRSDNGTINPADFLNDTMSTNQSFQTIATLDLQMTAEALMEAEMDYGDNSDAESEMTSDTLPELANFLAQTTDLDQEEVRQMQQLAAARTTSSTTSVEPAGEPSAEGLMSMESPGASSMQSSNASSVQSRVFTKPRTFSSPAAARSPVGGKKRRLSGSSVASTPDTPDSFDHTTELTITAEVSKMKVFGSRSRASLSTSVVQERPQQRKASLRRASVGPIASSSSQLTVSTVSSASKSKAKKAKSDTPELPAPASPAARVTSVTSSSSAAGNLNDSNSSAMALAPPSALKSCLSTRKISRPGHLRFDADSSMTGSAFKRNVVFGSPQACEFNKTSPTTNFTPLHHDHAKSLFSMAAAGPVLEEEGSLDTETEENDAQMDEWERLSNASERWSDEDEPCEEFVDDGFDMNQSVDSARDSVSNNRRASMSGGKRRRDSKKMPTIDLETDSSSEASRDLFPGSPEKDTESSRQAKPFYATSVPAELSISAEDSFDVPYVIQMEPLDASAQDSMVMNDQEDVTHTVNLPDSLAELMAQNAAACTAPAPIVAAQTEPAERSVNLSTFSDASHTQEIEVNLRSLMDKMSRAHYQPGATSVDDNDDQSMISAFSDAGSQRMSILAGFDVADLSVSMIEGPHDEQADALGALIGRESNASTIQTFAPEEEVNVSVNSLANSVAKDTSVHSVRSTRSTRSTRSSSGSAASVSAPVSVDSQASKASKKGRKGKKSPVNVEAAVDVSVASQRDMELSTHSDAPLLEMSSFGEDDTYQLEGSLAAMVNTLARSESAEASAAADEPASMTGTSTSPPANAAQEQAKPFELSMHSESGAHSLDMSSFRDEDDNTYQLEGSLAAMVNQLTAPTTSAATKAVVEAGSAWQQPQEISVIEGMQGEYPENEDMECDFSALESPRPSHAGIATRTSGNDSVLLNSTDLNQSGNSRVLRRSHLSRARQSVGGVLNMSQDALNEFSLLASNEQEEDEVRELAAAAPNSIMHRLQNLNKGARNNSLLQAGTPVTRPEQSRMSIGFKRQSLYGANNLNNSVNMSVLPGSQPFSQQSKSAVKSSKKARRNPDLSLLEENLSILSPTPSMAKVYGGPTSPTVEFNSNPLRSNHKQPQQQKELTTPGRGMLAVLESAEEDAMTVETSANLSAVHANTSAVSDADTSVLNETTTDYVPIVANLRNKLHSFFSAVQTVKTVLSTYSSEIRQIVQNTMESQIQAAYVDSPLQYVPLEALLLAWSMSPTESEQYAQHVVEHFPQSYRQQRLVHPDQHHDQLWVNMCAKTIIDHTAALKRAQEAHQAAQQAEEAQSASQGDRFYNKALNRDPTLKSTASSDFSAMLTAQQAESAALVKRSLQETEMLIDIVNKLTYCRVTTFTSSCVRINAILSATVTAELTFQLKRSVDSADQVVLTIQNVLVDLAIKQDKSTPQVTQAQNLFVTAYFASVMCSDELEGCLSQNTLLAAAEPSDIPALLHKISGSIAELRWTLLRLSTLSGGYKCTVAKTTAEQGGFKALITLPSLSSLSPQQKRGVLHVSVKNFVSACNLPLGAPMEGFVVREGSNEEITGAEREEMLSQLQVRLDSCLPR